MTEALAALFWGIVSFSILIVIHEGGHFLAARAFGVHVHEFMIGLPGPAIRFRGRKTVYGITAVPLGGYVRIAGMEPGQEDPLLGDALAVVVTQGTVTPFDVARALAIPESRAEELLTTLVDWHALERDEGDEHVFRSRLDAGAADPETLLQQARSATFRGLSVPRRIAVLAMGALFNLLAAILVFTIVLAAFGTIRETGRVGAVGEGTPAARAGITVGDRIRAVESIPTPDFHHLVTTVARFEPGDTVTVTVERGDRTLQRTVTLARNPGTGRALLGVSPQIEPVRLSVLEAFFTSFTFIGLTFEAIAGFFRPETFSATVALSSSVIGASVAAADAARAGVLDYAGLVAALSLSLGAINLVPIPPLDGGKIALEVIEWLRGRPLSRRFSLALSAAGALVLFALIGYLMYADIAKLSGS